ncbi:Bro-N domain-containing protein [Methanobrevibacter sp.]|uniref:BRO-N domain-containing protein n=1 Tax=Methanobrevibacter sp. TaxID=66852 RepID=UPI00388E6303
MKNSLVKSDNSGKTLTDFQGFENGIVDCFEENNNLWFRLSDIAKVLEVGRSTASMWKDMADEDELVFKKVEHSKEPAPYGSESLLYRILNRSNSPMAKPFERWVTKEVIPSIRKSGSYQVISIDPLKDKEIGLERAKLLREIAAEYNGNSKTWKQIIDAHATKELTGEFLLPLPEVTEHGKTAEMIGKPYGLSCQKVGAIAKKLGITKTDDNGFTRVNKAKNCNREVETFYYNESAEKKIVQAIEKELEECQKK